MPRKSRKDYNTSFFHVIVQGINKEYIFQKEMYKKKYLNLIIENYKEYNVKILAYCIMDNHTHLLIYSENNQKLSDFMKKINEDYGRFYNYMETRVGHVFRNRFLTEEITSETYLIDCLVYIHNNPVKANIVRKCDKYQYSSYHDYLKKGKLIDDEAMMLVFHTNEIELLDYENKHLKKDFYFKEYENTLAENMKEIIKSLELEYKNSWNNIIKEKSNIELLVPRVKQKIDISNYQLAKYFKIHRHRVERILMKYYHTINNRK